MKLIRWIIFVPASLIINVVCTEILKYLLVGLSFFWDSAGSYSRYGEGVESENTTLIIILEFMIPAISNFIAIMVGINIAPNKRKLALIILCSLLILLSIIFLFTIYSDIWIVLSSVLGILFAFYSLYEK